MGHRVWHDVRLGKRLGQRRWRERYCIDMRARMFFGPEDYFDIDPVYRFWLWPADVRGRRHAQTHAVAPARGCRLTDLKATVATMASARWYAVEVVDVAQERYANCYQRLPYATCPAARMRRVKRPTWRTKDDM